MIRPTDVQAPSRRVARSARNLFLAGKQLSLDVQSLPKVITGTKYNAWLRPHEWNEWLHASSHWYWRDGRRGTRRRK